MRLLKIGIANINTTVGAVVSNTDTMIALAAAMTSEGVGIASFSEQVIGGYPPEDLVQWRAFLASQRTQLRRFATAT